MSVRSPSVLVVLALAVAASVVGTPLVLASAPAGATQPAETATADSAPASHPGLPHSEALWTPETVGTPTACTTTAGLADASTNATAVGASVGFADDTQPVGGAAAATVDATPATDDRAEPPRAARLTRRAIAPRTFCATR